LRIFLNNSIIGIVMEIDLHNFFKFHDEKNPKHVNAIEELEKEIRAVKPELLQDTANWVRVYRTPNTPPPVKREVPFFPQTDNFILPDSTCNSSSCAMCLEYYLPGSLPPGPRGDDAYLKKVLEVGNSENHNVQTQVLNSYGLPSSWTRTMTFKDLDEHLEKVGPIAAGILHRGPHSSPTKNGGHIIVIHEKLKNGNYRCNDPMGDLYDGYTGSVQKGKNVIYERSVLEKRWTVDGPSTGWGRLFFPKKPQPIEVKEQVVNIPKYAIDLIKEYEGFSSKAYYDPHTGNLPITIGYGSTRKLDGTPFRIGETITKEEAEKLLIYQLTNQYILPLQKIPYWNEMNEKQQGALLSFAYNLGANFYGSLGFNTISRVLREKKWNEVPSTLELYRNPGSNVEAGLRRRRIAEGKLWTEGLSG
jgi:GH24 family phage-related lysozyme (muramidase)